MPEYGTCGLCGKGQLALLEQKNVANTPYNILRCSLCKHEVAKRVE